jgi:hypothetical protein
MRKLVFAGLILLFVTPPASAQLATIGIFADTTGTTCNVIAGSSGVVQVHVVVNADTRLTAAEFSAPVPACFNAVWLGETSPFVTIGESQTGISIGLGYCYPVPVHVLTINYFVAGTTPACCYYDILPADWNNDILFVDCDAQILTAQGLLHTINGDASCFCGIDPPPSTPANPTPSDGRSSVDILTQLTWESSDPAGDPVLFDVYFGTNPSPPLVAADQPQTSYDPGFLEFGTDYYWKIVATDDKGMESEGPVWTFKTDNTSASTLAVQTVVDYCGPATSDTVRIDVLINDAARPIDAGGLDLSYDSSLLTYIGCAPGDLTAGWQTFACSDLGTHVRVGGFNTTPIPEGSSGSFARLTFVSNCCNPDSTIASDMCPENRTDDLLAMYAVCGTYYCTGFVADGDVNDDGNVTPGDALCAFEGYLSFPDPPASGCGSYGWDVRADVDCNDLVTPGDALCVFYNWLDGSCVFCGQAAAPASSPRPVVVSAGSIRRDGDVVVVAIAVSGVPSLDAFGFDVLFPDGVTDRSAARSTLTRNFEQFGYMARESARLRVGGYHTSPIDAGGPAGLVELRFRLPPVTDAHTLTVDGFVDDLAGATPLTIDLAGATDDQTGPARFVLHQNHPNPFNPETEIRYEIPEGAAPGRVTLSVFNVEGKMIRRLGDTSQGAGVYQARWKGRNDAGEPVSSGVYFYVLHTAERTLTRKAVLLK